MPKSMKVGPYTRLIFDQDDWLAGMNPQYVTGLTTVPAPQYGSGLGEALRFNPFRYLGYASPGFMPTDVTNVSVVTTNILNVATGVESSVDYAYGVGSDALLHRLIISTKTLSNAGSWPHTIAVTGAITGSDIVAYSSNVTAAASNPVPCIYYSFNDAGGTWNVGQFRTDTGGFDDNFLSTVPATPITPSGNTKPHPLIVGADDLLYIGDGNVIQAYDGATGADGTCSTAVLTLPQGYIITSFARYAQPTPFLVAFAYYSPSGNTVTANATAGGPAKAFFWDYLSLDPTYVIDLNDRVVTAAFEWRGTIGCFTQGNNLANDGTSRFCRMKIWNGSIFESVVSFIGNPPGKGGVDVVGDSIQWVAYNGSTCNVNCYGAPFDGVKAGYNILATGSGTTTTGGVLRTIGATIGFQLLSTGATTSGGLQYMKVGSFAGSASVRTITACPQFPTGQKGKVRAVGVDFAKTSSSDGAPIDVYLIYENGGTSQVVASTSEITTANLTKWYYVDQAGAKLPKFQEIGVLARWTAGAVDTDAPILRRVMIDYEEVPVEGS